MDSELKAKIEELERELKTFQDYSSRKQGL